MWLEIGQGMKKPALPVNTICCTEFNLCILEYGMLQEMISTGAHELDKLQLGRLLRCRKDSESQQQRHILPLLFREWRVPLIPLGLNICSHFEMGEFKGQFLKKLGGLLPWHDHEEFVTLQGLVGVIGHDHVGE